MCALLLVFAVVVGSACAAPAVRQDASQTCTASGNRCAGAPFFPFVTYFPCCDSSLVCGPRRTPGAGLWGSFCINANEASASTPAPPTNGTAPIPASTAPAQTTVVAATAAAGAAAGAANATTPAPSQPIATRGPIATSVPVPVAGAPGGTAANATATAPTSPSPTTAASGFNTSATEQTTTVSPTAVAVANATAEPGATSLPNATETAFPNATETTLPNATETILPNGTRASVSPTPSSDNGSVCFPASSLVQLEDGSVITMDQLAIGDMVKVGPGMFSKVFMFTHKLAGGAHSFVQLTTSSGATISVTSGHYLPIDGVLVAASNVAVGDVLQLGDGTLDKVVSLAVVQGSGLYNPQTLHGDIVVNGVVASTYTTAVAPSFAHAVLAPFRTLSAVLGIDFTFLESGGGLLEVMAPRGRLST